MHIVPAARARRVYRIYRQNDGEDATARRLYDRIGQPADVVQYRMDLQDE